MFTLEAVAAVCVGRDYKGDHNDEGDGDAGADEVHDAMSIVRSSFAPSPV